MSEQKPAGRIFISYRRTDTPHIAGRLSDRLELHFGTGNVFMDVDSIEPGLDFHDAIIDAVGTCDVLVALIGRQWLNATDEHGRPRLHDPDDLVALEITTALDRGIRVIPVLIDGATPPRRNELPHVLAHLARRHTVRIDHATFTGDVSTLTTALERAFTPPPAAENRHPRPGQTLPASRRPPSAKPVLAGLDRR
jgi:TIR domain